MHEDDQLRVSHLTTTIRSLVEDKLRTAIVNGRFVPGQRLVERELCELTGVGRTTVREALRQLDAEGLISIVPHRGPIVAETSFEEARQLYDMRELLEGFAGEAFVDAATDAEVASLGDIVNAFEGMLVAPDRMQLLALKSDFYCLLMDGARNIFLTQTLRSLHNRIQALRVTSMMQPGRLPYSVREIIDIHAAIVRRDRIAAGEMCRRHVRNAAEAALPHFKPGSETEKGTSR